MTGFLPKFERLAQQAPPTDLLVLQEALEYERAVQHDTEFRLGGSRDAAARLVAEHLENWAEAR